MYFTIQPEGLVVVGGRAEIIYPNAADLTSGSRVQFWSYEADYGWETYGVGAVTPDGRSVVPSRACAN